MDRFEVRDFEHRDGAFGVSSFGFRSFGVLGLKGLEVLWFVCWGLGFQGSVSSFGFRYVFLRVDLLEDCLALKYFIF